MARPCLELSGIRYKYVWRCGERYTGPEAEGWRRALWGESEKEEVKSSLPFGRQHLIGNKGGNRCVLTAMPIYLGILVNC